jgi:CDP-6-deoxy-D-xylo-4-hexulose-3-dehydrase
VIDAERAGDIEADAYLIPSLLGNQPDWEGLLDWCKPNRPPVIEDACDMLGHQTQADIVTTSFYASHVITCMGGGGMACFDSRVQADRARLLTYWGRQSTFVRSDEVDSRYVAQFVGVPYDAKFTFPAIGYNLQPIEAQAAFGLVQLDRLSEFRAKRREHFRSLLVFFSQFADMFTLPVPTREDIAWLALPLTVRSDAPFTRLDIVRHLEANGIQTRPIMAGNILRQPGFASLYSPHEFPVADDVMRGGFLIGCHQGMSEDDVAYVCGVASDFLRRYSRRVA